MPNDFIDWNDFWTPETPTEDKNKHPESEIPLPVPPAQIPNPQQLVKRQPKSIENHLEDQFKTFLEQENKDPVILSKVPDAVHLPKENVEIKELLETIVEALPKKKPKPKPTPPPIEEIQPEPQRKPNALTKDQEKLIVKLTMNIDDLDFYAQDKDVAKFSEPQKKFLKDFTIKGRFNPDLEKYHPIGKDFKFVETNEVYYREYQEKVYTKSPQVHEQDHFLTASRKINYSVVHKDSHFRTPEFRRRCWRTNCQGVIERQGENWWGECKQQNCRAIDYFFEPQEYQEHLINNDANAIFDNIGGYGSGKTTASAAKIFRMMIEIPNSHALAFGQTLQQALEVGKVELERFIPPRLIERNNKNFIKLKNGSWIMFLSSDKADKVKGYNLTYGWVVEYNRVSIALIEQLVARNRQAVADVIALDANGNQETYVDDNGANRLRVTKRYHFIIIESNPDASSTSMQYYTQRTDEFISTEHTVHPTKYQGFLVQKLPTATKVLTYVSTGIDNPFLPEEQVSRLTALKGVQYNRMVLVDLTLRDGLVYQDAHFGRVNRIPIPMSWPRVFAADFGGGHAPTVMIAAALDIDDPKNPKAYIYDMYLGHGADPSFHVPAFQTLIYGDLVSKQKYPMWPVLNIIGDPKGAAKEVGAKESIFDIYRMQGIPFEKAFNKKKTSGRKYGSKEQEQLGGIAITNELFANGKLFYFNDLDKLDWQINNLRYEAEIQGDGVEATFKSVKEKGSRDDIVDCVRYLAAELQRNIFAELFLGKNLAELYKLPVYSKTIYGAHSMVIIPEMEKDLMGLQQRANSPVYIPQKNGKITTIEDLNNGGPRSRIYIRPVKRR